MKPLSLLLLLACMPVLAARAQNQIVYDDSLENGWQNYSWATVTFTNTSPVHSGTASIKVVDPGTSYEALYLHQTPFSGSGYQSLTFWVYPPASGSNELNLQATINGTAQTNVYLSFTAAQVHTWVLETIPLSSLGVAQSTAFDGFWIQNNTGHALTFYVDDISLIAVPPPSLVTLSVNAQNIVRTIDSRTYGLNLAIWDSLLSGTASEGLVDTMQTGVFRFPGGSDSDDYDWQKDESVSNPTFQWASNASTFAGITASSAAQAYVTVNYGSGTPQAAAAWVAYYNGSATNTTALGTDSKGRNWNTIGYWANIRGSAPLGQDDGYNFLRVSHPAPYGIEYWEVGNECYGSWEYDLHGTSGSTLSGTAYDPFTYAETFEGYYNQMLAVDPAIHIGAVAVPGEDSYGVGTHAAANPAEGGSLHTGWTPVMLATLKSLGVTPQFLIVHEYPQGAGAESDAGLLQDGGSIESDATNVRAMIDDYFGASPGSSIELALTELNSVSNNPGKQTTSLVNGLFLADAVGNFTQTEFNECTWWAFRNGSNTSGNNSSSLYGWRDYGDYGVVASGDVSGTPANTPYPTFYAAKLLTYWGRGGDPVVSATSNYGLLSIYGAVLLNGDLSLLVINKHSTNDLAAQINLSNFTPGSTNAALYSYGKPNDLNGLDLTTGTTGVSGTTLTYTFPSYSMTVLVVKSQFEAWREQYFTAGQLSNWTSSGDNGNPAGDGVPNLVKYALGLNPNRAASTGLPVIGEASASGNTYLTLSFTQQSSLTDISYNVQVSSDLVNWSAGPVRIDNGSTSTAIYRDSAPIGATPRHFMRLTVTRQ